MICLVGSSPSSGSTLLADILDSSKYSVCGPELEIFANEHLYNRSKTFLSNPLKTSFVKTIKARKIRFHENRLASYGLGIEAYSKLVKSSSDYLDFETQFFNATKKYRSKDDLQVVFEKSPVNVNVIEAFLRQSEGYFVYLVRNPKNVLNSLLKREFGNYISSSTWLVNYACVREFLNHPRVITVKYEDLVDNPFEVVSSVLAKVTSRDLESVEELEYNYLNNPFRKDIKRIKTWDNNSYGKIKASTKIDNPKTLEIFNKLQNYKVSKKYANRFGLGELTFMKALSELNYKADFKSVQKDRIFYDKIDYWKMYSKFITQYQLQNVKASDLKVFLNPIELIAKS